MIRACIQAKRIIGVILHMLYYAESVEEQLKLETLENPSLFERMISSFDWSAIRNQMITTGIRMGFALIVFYILRKISTWAIDLFFKKYFNAHTQQTNRYETIYRVTYNIFNTIYYFFLFYTILEILNFPVGTLLASAGVVGLAVSLGAQGFVSDLVNGFTMLFEKQIEIGDEVTLDEITGEVLNVSLRTTQVKDFDGTVHFIPNREIAIISNRSKADMRALINVRLYPDTDIEKVRQIIEAVNEKYIPQFPEITVPPADILFSSNQKNQLTLRIVMFTKPGGQYKVMNKFYELYVRELTAQNIELPYSDIEIA